MKKASFFTVSIFTVFLILVWPVGAQTPPVGYFQHGDFFCNSDPNFEKPTSAGVWPIIVKFCESQITGCQAVGGKFCPAGTLDSCCLTAGSTCGTGLALGLYDVAVCVPPTPAGTTCTAKSPGYAGTTQEGINICCPANQEPGPAGGTKASYCQPKSESACAPGEQFVRGTGDNQGEKRCCSVNTVPAHHPNGFPFCARLPLIVLAPNGGEQISKTVPYQVKWTTSTNIPSTQLVKIRLLDSQGRVAYQNNFPNTGSRNFLFASNPPGQYKIEVSAVVDGETITDQSDNFFTLVGPPPSLQVLVPNGEEQILRNTPYQVRWITTNLPSTQLVKIRLLNFQGATVYQNVFPNTGSRDFLFASNPPGQYKIELSTTVDGQTIRDQSDSFFTLTNRQFWVKVLAPNGGEQIPKRDPFSVRWTTSGIPVLQQIKLELINAQNQTVYHDDVSPVTGLIKFFNFNNPAFFPGQYKFKLSATVDGQTVTDQSDSFFTLTDLPMITVLAPNGGEQIPKSDPPYRVRWKTSGIPAIPASQLIKFELINAWNLAIYHDDIPNTGSIGFRYAELALPHGQYKIKLSATVDGQTITDQSDNFFTLTGNNDELPYVSITNPARNDQTVTGSFPLTATFSGSIKKVQLYIDNRLDWTSPANTIPTSPVIRNLPAQLPVSYLTVGTHYIRFVVTDNLGRTDSAGRSIKIVANTPPSPPPPSSDTTPPVVILQSPSLGPTTINKATNILIKVTDPSGVRNVTISAVPMREPILQKFCTIQYSPGVMYCTLTVPADLWKSGLRLEIFAVDKSLNQNSWLDRYFVTSDQLEKQDSSGFKTIVPPDPACHTFNANLSIGMTGSEVTALQTALTRAGFAVSASGNFDEATASAVSSFQLQYRSELLTANGLTYPTGYFSSATRQKMNSLYGCG